MTKILLIVSALLEAIVGLVLIVIPALAVSLLLGAPLYTPVGLVAARLAGAALLSLGIVCWQARNGERGGSANGVVSALLFYNEAAVAVLVYAGVFLRLQSTLLWPAIGVHQVLSVWCLVNLWFTRRTLQGSLEMQPENQSSA